MYFCSFQKTLKNAIFAKKLFFRGPNRPASGPFFYRKSLETPNPEIWRPQKAGCPRFFFAFTKKACFLHEFLGNSKCLKKAQKSALFSHFSTKRGHFDLFLGLKITKFHTFSNILHEKSAKIIRKNDEIMRFPWKSGILFFWLKKMRLPIYQ